MSIEDDVKRVIARLTGLENAFTWRAGKARLNYPTEVDGQLDLQELQSSPGLREAGFHRLHARSAGLYYDDHLLWNPASVRMGDALIYLPFDGNGPYSTNFAGSLIGHLGQAPAVNTGGVIFRPGKFGKAVQISEATTNLMPYSSFEGGLLGWGSTGTFTQSSEQALFGSYSGKVVATGASSAAWGSIVASPGQVLTFSVFVLTKLIQGGSTQLKVSIDWYNGSSAFISQTAAAQVSVSSNSVWTRYIVTGTAPATTASAVGAITLYSATVGDVFYLDGAQFENKAYATPYCDGSLGQGHSWSGTAFASTSSRTVSHLSYSILGAFDSRTGTLRAWVYHNGTADPASGVNLCLYDGTRSIYVQNDNSASKMLFMHYNGSSYVPMASSAVLTAGWHQVVITWSGTTAKFYVDGAYIFAYSSLVSLTGTPSLYVGEFYAGSNQCNSLVDDVGILPSVLSDAQVLADYECNLPLLSQFPSNVNALGGLPYTLGPSFPANPVVGHRHFRTDLGWECYYTGSVWVTEREYTASNQGLSTGMSATGSGYGVALRADYQFLVTRCVVQIHCNATQDASNNWSIQIRSINSAYSGATVLYQFSTNGITTGAYVDKSGNPSTTTDATNKYWIDGAWVKNGAPGNINFLFWTVFYRYIVT